MNGPNSGVAFAPCTVDADRLATDAVAFANFRGGVILLGVEDDGAITGIQRHNLEEWVMDTVFGRYVHPMILPFFETVHVDAGRRVAVISLTQGTSKPYVLRLQDREEIYIRVGSTSRKASRAQQARLFALGGLLHAELLPVSGTGLANLDLERLHDYLGQVLRDPEVPADADAWVKRLTRLGFMTERSGGAEVCTIAGVVLFGRRPRRVLRQAGVRWMAFPGDCMDYAAEDDGVLDDALVGLWRTEDGNRTLERGGLLEAVIERMRPKVSERSPRNPLIVDVLRDYGYVDARGMGVRTKIVPLLISHNGVAPEFEATDDYLTVRMFRGAGTASGSSV